MALCRIRPELESAMTMLRDAMVPMPKGETPVSPWRTEMRAFWP